MGQPLSRISYILQVLSRSLESRRLRKDLNKKQIKFQLDYLLCEKYCISICRFCCKTSFKSEDNTKLRYVGSSELQNVFLGKTPSPLVRILVARILVVIVFFSGKDIS